MLESGTDPESYITEYTFVYADTSSAPVILECCLLSTPTFPGPNPRGGRLACSTSTPKWTLGSWGLGVSGFWFRVPGFRITGARVWGVGLRMWRQATSRMWRQACKLHQDSEVDLPGSVPQLFADNLGNEAVAQIGQLPGRENAIEIMTSDRKGMASREGSK